jgi:peptidoglycan/LPS O-acetylase OafA/YrhL
MEYRREIDGLRALAVVPVVLFHADIPMFSGGFVGVDVFFVISGYLITYMMIENLRKEKFSIVQFYERRARRILPTLYLVMAVSTVFAYMWMMPDEFKNYGQSIFATALFANNILLSITSGYWDMASEFKPFLHTWSLGVEEQYYIIFPLFMIVGWVYFRSKLVGILIFLMLLSLSAAILGAAKYPNSTFFLLPTRAWEIILGALSAFYLSNRRVMAPGRIKAEIFSSAGILLIVASIFGLTKDYSSPGLFMIAPTLGAVLIIIFTEKGTVAHSLLSGKVLVGLGLMSYSMYLWRQPLIAFSKVYFATPPKTSIMLILVFLDVLLSYFSWRFVEKAFRDRSSIGRRGFISFAVLGLAGFVFFGYYLNVSYGIPSRIFDASVKIEDMDKRIYNDKVFGLKKDAFLSARKLKILVIGNSSGRDFVNMMAEAFDMRDIEVVYRDDLADCILPYKDNISKNLFNATNVIVFASGFNKRCIYNDISYASDHDKDLFYAGRKHFGYNLNWLSRLDPASRAGQRNPLPVDIINQEQEWSSDVPAENYISLLAPVVKDGLVPITDELGRMLSTDRVHVTKYGAKFFGEHALRNSVYGNLLLAGAPSALPVAYVVPPTSPKLEGAH